MKKRFKYLALREAKNTGAFGHYLTMPVTDKTKNADYRGTAGVSERNGWFITARRLRDYRSCQDHIQWLRAGTARADL